VVKFTAPPEKIANRLVFKGTGDVEKGDWEYFISAIKTSCPTYGLEKGYEDPGLYADLVLKFTHKGLKPKKS
jgi:hypothetical protein